ncbi:death-inducer obliterator 1-like, partial [Seriola lalandi dorsalis]
MSESDAAKLVANIEMEMFDIFRNTDSKYMNKYRTIMFNIKDPRNKGLLYRVVRGEISPFRLARMSQKDMQATKAPEPSPKETPEVKDAAAKATSLPQKPEAVKVDLPSLNPARPDRRSNKRPDSTVASQEQKRSLPAPALKNRALSSQSSATPDILTCMLKDTTSEHKAHLFDLKCKICT